MVFVSCIPWNLCFRIRCIVFWAQCSCSMLPVKTLCLRWHILHAAMCGCLPDTRPWPRFPDSTPLLFPSSVVGRCIPLLTSLPHVDDWRERGTNTGGKSKGNEVMSRGKPPNRFGHSRMYMNLDYPIAWDVELPNFRYSRGSWGFRSG
jgi:hypothetical protein